MVGGSSPQATLQTGPVTLGQTSAYLGTAVSSCRANCLRAPGMGGNDVVVSQPGNASNFQAVSSDPSVVTGVETTIVSLTQSVPGIELIGQRAGTASVTIVGNNGSAAQLPVTVTTVCTKTFTLSGLPTAAGILACRDAAESGLFGVQCGLLLQFGRSDAAGDEHHLFILAGDGRRRFERMRLSHDRPDG